MATSVPPPTSPSVSSTLTQSNRDVAPKAAEAKAEAAPVAAPPLKWVSSESGVVVETATGYEPAKNRSLSELKDLKYPRSAMGTTMLVRSLDTASLSLKDRIGLLKTVTNPRDNTIGEDDKRRQEAVVALLNVPTDKSEVAKAMYQGVPGDRLIDRVGAIVRDNALDVKMNEQMGRELRRHRTIWGRTYEAPAIKDRVNMATVAASRDLLHATFPFNDGPYTSISSSLSKDKLTVTLNASRGPIALGSFDVSSFPGATPPRAYSSAEIQKEISARFNEYRYGTRTAPKAFLNALVPENAKTAGPPAAVLANAVSRTRGTAADTLTMPGASWSEFLELKEASPEAIKKELISKYSRFFSPNQAKKFAASIQVDGQRISMPVKNSQVVIEAKQLGDRARDFLGADVPPNFEFVRRVDGKLKFVIPASAASAFDPLGVRDASTPAAALESLRKRMVELELGSPKSTAREDDDDDDAASTKAEPASSKPENLATFSESGEITLELKDAKRLMAASQFSYAGDAKHDARNLYGGAQLAGLAYLPFDGVIGNAEYVSDNRDREAQKRQDLKTPPGALTDKLRRLGFEIEKEVATPLGQALVVRNDKLGLVRVVFRGSDRKVDFETDAKAGVVSFKVGDKTFNAPHGFLESVQSMYPKLVDAVASASDKLKKKGLEPKLGVDGHSKGGAEAALFALISSQDPKTKFTFQQVNLIEPARSIGRWDVEGEGTLGLLKNYVKGVVKDVGGHDHAGNAAEVYEKSIGDKTAVWAMSRDVVPHLGFFGIGGKVKPGGVLLFDEASGMIRFGKEQKADWFENPLAETFVDKQKALLRKQGISLSSHMMGTVEPTIFNQIGSGVLTD